MNATKTMLAVVSLMGLTSCATFPPKGAVYYTAVNIWYTNPQDIRTTNYHQGVMIAEHPRASKPYQMVLQRDHYGNLGKPREHSLTKNPTQSAPEVEIRSLDVYASLTGGELHG